jgi:hypothetical protein
MLTLSFKVKNKKYAITSQKGEDLVILLDKFLKKNKIRISQIESFSLDISQEKSITSIRIAQAILKALNIVKECY